MFFSPNNIIFFKRFLLYSILFISFSQIHDFFLSLHKVFKFLFFFLLKNHFVGYTKNQVWSLEVEKYELQKS